ATADRTPAPLRSKLVQTTLVQSKPEAASAHPERSPVAPPPRPHSAPAPPANRSSNSVSAPAPASRQFPLLRRRSKAPPRAASGRAARGSCRPTPQSRCRRGPAAALDRARVVRRELPLRVEQSSRPGARCAAPLPVQPSTSPPARLPTTCAPPSPQHPPPPAVEPQS